MLDAIKKNKGAFRGVAVVDETAPDVAHKMRNLAALGVRGFRISPGDQPQTWLDSPGMAAMWKCAAETSQVMCTLVNPDALPSINRRCAKFPETKVVIDHLARLGMDGPIRDSDVSALRFRWRTGTPTPVQSSWCETGSISLPAMSASGCCGRRLKKYSSRHLETLRGYFPIRAIASISTFIPPQSID